MMAPTVQLQLGMSQATLGGTSNRIYMGRDPACGLSFGDPSLSRRHAEVFLEGGYAFIRDLGSSNGTWVNGQMVGAQPVQLMPGQTIYLGMVPLVASWHSEAGVEGGRTMAVAMPPELRAMVAERQAQMAMLARAPVATPVPGGFPQG